MSELKKTDIGHIPSDWDCVLFNEVAELRHGHQFRNYDFTTDGLKVVKITQIKGDGTMNLSSCSFIDSNRLEEFKEDIIYKGDILIALTGATIGKIARYNSEEVVLQNYRVGNFFSKDENKLSRNYLFQFLRSNFFFHQILARQTQSAQQNIGKDEINNMDLFLPPLPEQKAIAKVLTAFDDKIELLQAQNMTLETMAQTIFKEWFGKYQIGDELPEGWRVGEFGEVIEFINGYAFKSKDLSKEPIDNAYKVFKMGDIKKGGGFKPGKTKGYYPKSMSTKLNKYILKNGDLLMSMTDMKDAISLLGHTALMIYEDEYIVNQRVGLIRVKNDINIEYPYLYLLTNNDDFIAGIRAGANSGVQVNLSTQGIKETEFIIADKETNKAFNNVVMPLFEKRKANSQMIKELKKTRDTLLPKLMSGQVRVKTSKITTS